MTTETDHVPAAEPGNSWTGYKEPVHDAPLDPQAAPDELPGPAPRQTDTDPPAAAAEQKAARGPQARRRPPKSSPAHTSAQIPCYPSRPRTTCCAGGLRSRSRSSKTPKDPSRTLTP